MRKRVAITGVGVVSSLGDSPAALHAALCAGETGLHLLERSEFAGFHCRHAGSIPSFDAAHYLQGKPLRPLDRTAQMVTVAAKHALENSGCVPAKNEIGLILGTMFGSIHTISQFDRHAQTEGPSYASPLDFSNTVISAAAGQAAIWHNLRGTNSTIAGGAASGLMALGYAADLIRNGTCTALLAGGADEFCFESFCGFERTGLLAKTSEGHDGSTPFDARRSGFLLAEGAALLMLEEWESALARGATIHAELCGHGNAYDPGSARGTSQNAIARAMQMAITDARVSPSEMHCISASANGSVCGDRNEAFAIEAIFKGQASHIPVMAIKSQLGEVLGASGALQAVALLQTIGNGVLPGITGLQQAPDLPALNVSAQPRSVKVDVGLINSAGFDGNACSMLIARPER